MTLSISSVSYTHLDVYKRQLATHASFEAALKTVRDNLANETAATSRVYVVVSPQNQTAVFGVAMNSASDGEAWWVNKIGPDHMAGLPYEVFIAVSYTHLDVYKRQVNRCANSSPTQAGSTKVRSQDSENFMGALRQEKHGQTNCRRKRRSPS